MSQRNEHLFQFNAIRIAAAASDEADYHEDRLQFWKDEYDKAVEVVENTIGAKVEKRNVTGGYTVDVVVDYGDPADYRQMKRAFEKMNDHRDAAERYRSDQKVYETQADGVYLLDTNDVHYFRLGNEERED